jgi:hypothetical protein
MFAVLYFYKKVFHDGSFTAPAVTKKCKRFVPEELHLKKSNSDQNSRNQQKFNINIYVESLETDTKSRICGSHDSEHEDGCLLGCSAV